MRDISQSLLDEIDYARVFDARLKTYDERLRFTEMSQRVIDAQISEDIYSYDASTHSNGILRVASVDVSGTTYLFTQWIPDPTTTPWPSWVNKNITIGKYSKPGVVGNRVVYLKKTGASTAIIEWGDYNTSTGALDNITSINKAMDPDQPTAISPVAVSPSTTAAFYVHTNKFEPDVSDINYGYIYYIYYFGPASENYYARYWPGTIYGDNQHVYHFDVARLSDTDYIHLTDLDGKRGIYLTAFWGYGWSDVKQVYPLDAVDDTSLFTPSFVTALDGRIFATGILKRTAGMAMQIYTVGPEHFTAGRDMYVGTRGTGSFTLYYNSSYYTCPAMGGKLHLVGSKLYYIGLGIAYSSDAKSIVGVTPTPTEYAINNASLTQERTGSGVASMEIYDPLAGDPPSAGDIGALEIAYSDIWAKLATVDIDSVPKQHTETGTTTGIVGRPRAIKNLAQWQSDASYDYWSQAKQANCPTTRTENVISMGMGHWAESGGSAILDVSGEHGIMYATARPSRGMLVRGKFFYPAVANYYPKYGVIMHYYIETKIEAAERLSIEVEDVEDDDIGHYGIVALWGKEEYNSGPGIGIYLLYNNDWKKMASYSHSIPADTWHWLGAEYHDGQIKVWYRLDSSTDWALITTYQSEFYEENGARVDYLPFKHEEGIGRAALYMYNGVGTDIDVGTVTSAGFSSTGNIIPVLENPVDREVGADAIVQVDDEKILLNGRTNIPTTVNPTETAATGTLQVGAPNGSYEPPYSGLPTFASTTGTDWGRNYFDGCAMTYLDATTQGLQVDGRMGLYRICDYMHEAPDTWVPTESYTEPDHWALHIGDLSHGYWANQNFKVYFTTAPTLNLRHGKTFKVLNALHVSERGYDSTEPVKHAPGARVSIVTAGRIKCNFWEVYSTEQDMTFEWIATELAKKAGVLDVYAEKTLEDTLVISHSGWDLDTDGSTQELRPSGGIAKIKMVSGTEMGIMAPFEGGDLVGSWNGPLVTVSSGYIRYYDVDDDIITLQERVPIETDFIGKGWITMSFQEDHIGVWANDKLAAAFWTGQTPKSIMFVSNGAAQFDVDWSALDLRVDNFIFDMGTNGPSLMSQLIKQKRIYFQDDQNGDLRIFKSREIVNTVGTPNLLAASGGDTEVDPNRASRIRLEGAEFVEVLDEDQMQEWGNIFRLMNSEELDTPAQFLEEAQLILDDIALSTKRTTYIGAADPRIEPHDELWINLSDGDGSKKVVIRQATFRMNVGEDNAVFDMNLETENG